jgi:N-acetylglucosaminyldiphosphoundecaprenol N-acetyl-beta-D-mannosaminyltransferase
VREVPSYPLLGLWVDALTFSDLKAIIAETTESGRRCLVGHHNMHSVYLYHHDVRVRAFYDRVQYVYMDGVPLLWLGRALGYPLRLEHRPTCIEYMRPLMVEAARRGWRVFYLGSAPGVAERGARILRRELPGLRISTAHGYFSVYPDSEDIRKVLEMINAYRPNVLLVGMGMPRQEHWILDNLDHLQANTVISVGACMDFTAGEKSPAPRWMGPLLLEWLYRLLSEPRRLWKRYLLEPWFILWLILRGWARRGHAYGPDKR